MDAFLHELRTEGRNESAGHFTVDWGRAHALLSRHLLPRPEDGALKVVQAAVRAGASYLRVTAMPGPGFAYQFDRPALTPADLAALPGALLTPGAPLRDLALALHSTDVFSVRTPQGGVRGDREFWVFDPEWRGELEVRLSTTKPFLVDLARRCPHPPLELRTGGWHRAYAFPVAELRHEGARRHIHLPPSAAQLLIKLPPEEDYPELSIGLESDEGPARLWLSVAGVCQFQELPWKLPGVVAYVSADHLTTDLSGLRIVEDQAYEDLLDDLRRERERLVKAVRAKLPGTPPQDRLKVLRMGY